MVRAHGELRRFYAYRAEQLRNPLPTLAPRKGPKLPTKVAGRLWWPKWRLVAEKLGSPAELDTWSLLEIVQANDMLDMQGWVTAKSYEKKGK